MNQARSSFQKLGIAAVATSLLALYCRADDKVGPLAQSLLAAHNREREREQKPSFKLSAQLCEAARAHAADMAAHHKLDHKGSNGSTVVDRIKRTGYLYVRVGENIADGQKTVDQVMESWMKSPGHRANVLGDYTELGGARVEDDEGVSYWSVDFGIPMPSFKPDVAAAAVLKEINRKRDVAHKVLLKADPILGRAAMTLSAALAAKDSFELDGDPFKLIDEKALVGRDIRVQFSANVPSPEKAASELLGEKPEELDNFREIGIGYAQAKSGTPYWCAIFAKPGANKIPGRK
jgi:uncharacterized protein YkwD